MDTKTGESSPAATRKMAWRKSLVEKRQNLADRAWRNDLLQRVMRVWLIHRPDTVIGAYWPIKGEFDPLPALHRWKEDGELIDQPQPRRIGLPVVNKEHKTMIEALQKGDEVISGGGILGRVSKLNENYVTLEVAQNVEMTLQRSAIQVVLPKGTIKNIQ